MSEPASPAQPGAAAGRDPLRERLIRPPSRVSRPRAPSVDSHVVSSSLTHRRLPFKLNVARTGVNRFKIAMNDVFTTLLDMPLWKFMAAFFAAYLLQYCLFALAYLHQHICIQGVDEAIGVKKFLAAVWFSVQTSATIGYGGFGMSPDPECTVVNTLVMFQTVSAVFVNTFMMGIVFARFSSPMYRSHAHQFSKRMALNVGPHGASTLACRLANVKGHCLIRPSVKMLLVMPRMRATAAAHEAARATGDPPAPSAAARRSIFAQLRHEHDQPHADGVHEGGPFTIVELAIDDYERQLNNLYLGLPMLVSHTVDRRSPLAGATLGDLTAAFAEILVIVEGSDPATSRAIQIKHAYHGQRDIRVGRTFQRMAVWQEAPIGPAAATQGGASILGRGSTGRRRDASEGDEAAQGRAPALQRVGTQQVMQLNFSRFDIEESGGSESAGSEHSFSTLGASSAAAGPRLTVGSAPEEVPGAGGGDPVAARLDRLEATMVRLTAALEASSRRRPAVLRASLDHARSHDPQ